MARTRVKVVVASLGTVLLATAIALWIAAPYLSEAWRSYRRMQPLSASQAEAVQACAHPGWAGLIKVLEQDLDDPCPITWFGDVAASDLDGRAKPRLARLRRIASDPAGPSRARVRAGLALVRAGYDAPPDLAILLRTTEPRPRRAELVEAIVHSDWPDAWADPVLRLDVVLERTEDPAARVDAMVQRLWWSALDEDSEAGERRELLFGAALDTIDLTPAIVRTAQERHAAGRSAGNLPPAFSSIVLSELLPCQERASPACVEALAGVIERMESGPLRTDAPSIQATRALLDMIWAEHPSRARARGDLVQDMVAWVLEVEPADRPDRLLALLTGAPAQPAAYARGAGAGPEQIIVQHTGMPWTAALLLLEAATAASLPVQISSAPAGGVAFTLDGQRYALDDCGGRRAVDPEHPIGEPWPIEAVIAQAAVEAAGAAQRRGERVRAARLLTFATALDPRGVGSVSLRVEPLPSSGVAGRVAGQELRRAHVSPVIGAEQARMDRAMELELEASTSPCPALPELSLP